LQNISVYAVTAANGGESSYGDYCPPQVFYNAPLKLPLFGHCSVVNQAFEALLLEVQDFIDGTEIGSCLGDLFSTSWLENSELPGSLSLFCPSRCV
jgi:hypothetical protein